MAGVDSGANKDSTNNDIDESWFVFYVTAKHERKVESLLIRDGYTCYLPIISVLKQWTHRKKHVEEPLFKSYIFVKTKKNMIYDVLQIPSIVSYIRFSGQPAVVSQKHIDLIKDLIKNKTNFNISKERIKVGEQIILKSGPFEGEKGVVKEIRGTKKLLVVLNAIDFTLEIEL